MKKGILLLLIALSFTSTLLCQDLAAVDAKVLRYPSSYKSISILAQRIEKDFNTDLEKIRASYTWITENIAYSYNESEVTTKIYNSFTNDLQLSNEMGHRVLKTKKAICSGYSQLFQSIMNELSIDSRVVVGYAKTEINDIGKSIETNHAWNIVSIDNKEFLLDTTWGAGSWDNGFIKDRNYHYFFTPPEIFALKHYPENPEDTLLTKPLSKREFSFQPLIYTSLSQKVKVLKPLNGVLTRKPNRNIYTFHIETKLDEDWIMYKLGPIQVDATITKTETGYTFKVDISKNLEANTMVVYFGGQSLVGYRLK